MDKHEEIHAFTSPPLDVARAQFADRTPAPMWWRIRDLETAPRKLAGARLEGPSQGWPA